MPGRAARENRDALHVRKRGVADLHLLQEHFPGVLRNASQNRFARGGRLLVNLLEHEVLVAGLLRHDRVPQHPLRRLRDRAAEKIGELHTGLRDDCHLFVAEEHDIAGVAEDGRNVRCDEELAVAKAHDDRRAVAHGDDLFRIVGRDQHEREQPAHQQQGSPDSVLEPIVLHLALDQVRDDFGVGLGDELVALPLQLVLQVEVILDDAVVDDDDLPGAVAMRVGVLFGRASVRRPAGVADAVVAHERRQPNDRFEVRELTRAPAQIHGTVAHHGDAGRVVAAVFEPPQPVNQHGHHVLRPDVSNNAAHSYFFFRFFAQSSILRCLPALTASASAGTSSRMVEPLPTYAPSPTVTGAISCVSLPMNAPSPITV